MDSYIVFDLETTGFSPLSNEILEIGAWKIQDNVAISKFQELVKPKGYIPLEIQRMTHITSEMICDARDIEEVLPEFYEWCEDYPLLSHNLPFDFNFVYAKAKPMNYDFSKGGTRLGICTLKLSKDYFPGRSHKLADMATFFNISLASDTETFHRAEYDAYVAKLIYDRFKFLYPAVDGIITPSKIAADINKYGSSQSMGSLPFV